MGASRSRMEMITSVPRPPNSATRPAERIPEGLDDHVGALGLMSLSSYKLWCRRHGFGLHLDKTAAEHGAELEHHRKLQAPADPDAHPDHDPRRAERIRRIAAGALDDARLTDIDTRIRGLFADVGDVAGGPQALLRLLLHVERCGGLLCCSRGRRGIGGPRNLVISGLSQLARHHGRWIRPVEAWRPSRTPPGRKGLTAYRERTFAELAAHLLARYPVPGCLESVWFLSDPEEAAIQQGWYLHVAGGRNIRTAPGLPFALTKRAAHLFATSPSWMSKALDTLRWCQVRAIDPRRSPILAHELSWNPRIHGRAHADFWTEVVHFFLNNPMLERGYIGPIVDYIHHLKFEPTRVPRPDGSVAEGPPAHPAFCVKARSMAKLVRQVDAWHERLAVEQVDAGAGWDAAGFAEFACTEDNEPLNRRIEWTIHELRNAALLQYEGRVMGHCVGSYARRCQSGEVSVWSLRSRVLGPLGGDGADADDGSEEEEEAPQKHVLTIAVDNRRRTVTQARGRHNLLPHGRKMSRKQARRTDGPYWIALRESARILALWRTREGLGYAQE